jgi:hypothetical protein
MKANAEVFSTKGSSLSIRPIPLPRALCQFAQQLSLEAFAPYDPKTAQFEMPPEKYAAILEILKPKFIHHPTLALIS